MLLAALVLAAAPLKLPVEKLEVLQCADLDAAAAAKLLPKPRKPVSEEDSVEFGDCGKLVLPGGAEGQLLRVHAGFPAGEQNDLLLVVPGKGGCTATLSSRSASEAGSSTPSTRLNADLSLETTTVGSYPVQDIEGLDELVTTQSTRALLRLPGCKIEPQSSAYRDLSGEFTDAKSHEVLLVAGKRAFYRAKPGKKAQELKVLRSDEKGATVQFAKSSKSYELTLEGGGDALSCRNPDGTVQTFKRSF